MSLSHTKLTQLLQRAYSAEKAAAFAYHGHAGSVRNVDEKAAIKQIELDEWNHRKEVLAIMRKYRIPISRYYEWKYHVVGKILSTSCYFIGWFMPFYFAGRLESGNVCSYFVMMRYFEQLGIHEHDAVLYDMGMKEKEHELYFLGKLRSNWLLPLFEKLFVWGSDHSFNDIDIDAKYAVPDSKAYCQQHRDSILGH